MDDFNQRYYYDLVKNGGELADVPTKYITLEMCFEYLKRTRNLDGIPKEILIKLYAWLFCKNQDIKQIPKRVQTKQFWVEWFKLMQKSFLTQEICNTYFEKTGDIKLIPTEYITQEMCNKYFKKTGNIQSIPAEYVTQEMCNDYFIKTKAVYFIPPQYINSDLYENYFLKTGNISLIPGRYRTQEMYNKYFEKIGIIDSIPVEYRTQEMYNKYFEKIGDIYSVPIDYRTQEMCNEYFKKTGGIKPIPDKYKTQEMCDKYFEHTGDIKPIPDKYKTQEMCNEYFKKTGDIELIPDKYITKEMCDEYFKKTGDIKSIPDKYKTQEMWDKYFNFYHNLHNIPEQFISFEMCQRFFERYHDLYDIPDNYRELVSEDYFLRTGNLADIPKEYRINIAKNILTILENVMFTKNQLLKKFNWSDIQFDSIMKIISEDSSDIYLAIQNILNNNMKNYIFNTKARVEFLNDLVTSMNLKKQNELTKDQKILFTYQFFSQKPYRSLDVIWDWINRYPQKNKQLINFFRWYLKYKTAFDMLNYEVLSKKEQEMEHIPNWIKTYNLNKSMGSDDRPLSLFFVHDGETIVINKDDVKNVLYTLKENDVPTKNCIVNEAIRYYSYGALDEFIENLQLSSIVNEKAENKKI